MKSNKEDVVEREKGGRKGEGRRKRVKVYKATL